jgi:hypothetical protein
MPWFHAVAECDHAIQNPLAPKARAAWAASSSHAREPRSRHGVWSWRPRPDGRRAPCGGEPYWQEWPLPAGEDDLGFTGLRGVTSTIGAAGLRLTGCSTRLPSS